MHTIPKLLLTLQNSLGVHFPRLAVVVGASVGDALHSYRLVSCPPRQGDSFAPREWEKVLLNIRRVWGRDRGADLELMGWRQAEVRCSVMVDRGPSQKGGGGFAGDPSVPDNTIQQPCT